MPQPERLSITPRFRFVCWFLVFVLAWQSAVFPALAATLLDADGRAVQSTDALGRTSIPTYDNGGRVTQSTLFDRNGNALSTSSTHYDSLGRVDYSTDASGHQKRMVYDALGRLSAVIQATQGTPSSDGSGASDLVTKFVYDEVGHKIAQQDANGHITRFGYDVRGRMIWRALPLGQVEQMSYDAGGQLQSSTDFRGYVTTCSYDQRGRLVAKVPDTRLREATLTYSYPDENTRIAYRGAAATKQSYDKERGWLNSVSGPNGVVSYSYNPEGQKLAMTAPSGTTGYGYDVMGRLALINDQPAGATSATSIAAYNYDAVGNLSTLTRGNGVVTRYAYDEQNRLSDLVHTANAGDLSRFHYSLRADGKRTAIGETVVDAPDATTGAARSSVRNLAYTYDNAGKLTSETGQDGLGVAYANSWNYDAVGNRISATVQKAATAGTTTSAHTTSVSAVFNANDQLTSQSSSVDGGTAAVQNFSYDANGAEAGTSTASGTSTNGWNFEGKLTQTALSDASGNAAGGSANVFDAAGDRLSHTDNLGKTGQKTTSYLVDTDTSYSQVIEERAPDVSDAAGQPALQARYVWGEGLSPLAMWRKLPDGSVKLFFHLSDGQESIRQLIDAAGAVVDSYFYDAWGNTLDGSSNHVVNPFRYTGQQLDADGKYYLRARFYNPGTGRFLSHDPLMGNDDDPASLHRYLYAGDDGVNACDPTGLYSSFRQALGMFVHTEVESIYGATPGYSQDVRTGRVLFDTPTALGDDPTLKPDIFNMAKSHWIDIKPWSWSGIEDAIVTWRKYNDNFSPLGYTPNSTFLSIPIIIPVVRNNVDVSGQIYDINTTVLLFNIHGIVFWKELKRQRSQDEIIVMGREISQAQSGGSLRGATDDLRETDDFEVTPPPSRLQSETVLSWSEGLGVVVLSKCQVCVGGACLLACFWFQ